MGDSRNHFGPLLVFTSGFDLFFLPTFELYHIASGQVLGGDDQYVLPVPGFDIGLQLRPGKHLGRLLLKTRLDDVGLLGFVESGINFADPSGEVAIGVGIELYRSSSPCFLNTWITRPEASVRCS